MSAPDITADFLSRLRTNGLFASTTLRNLDRTARYVAFCMLVRSGGLWDFKANVYRGFQQSGVAVCGREYRYDMPGNYHYGFVGAAAGFPDTILLSAAGGAQIQAGTSRPEYWCTYGDDPEDSVFITLGIGLYREAQLGVTTTNLHRSLARFVLVGDSGEQDPEVYGGIARKHPGQVSAIFIRNVTGEKPESDRFRKAFEAIPQDRWRVFEQAAELEPIVSHLK